MLILLELIAVIVPLDILAATVKQVTTCHVERENVLFSVTFKLKKKWKWFALTTTRLISSKYFSRILPNLG